MDIDEDKHTKGENGNKVSMIGDNVDFDHRSYNREEQEKAEAYYGNIIIGELLDKIGELATLQDKIKIELCNQKLLSILDGFQENPKLLDHKLEEIVNLLLSLVKNRLADDKILHRLMKIFYLLVKTRGSKVIARMFPHSTDDLQNILVLLEHLDPHDFSQWETRYIFMLWLSVLCIIPFDISRFHDDTTNTTYAQRIVNVSVIYMKQCDKSSDAASLMLSKFLTRDDIKSPHLANFIHSSLSYLNNGERTTMSGSLLFIGYLRTLAQIFKHGKRNDMLQYVHAILESLENQKGKVNSVISKLRMKVIQRLAMTMMTPRVATWRYQRGRRTLESGDCGSLVETALPSPSSLSSSLSHDTSNHSVLDQDDQEEIVVPEAFESVIEELVNGLRDSDTVVRWSAAKGIGRVTNLVDKDSANDIIEIVLSLFEDGELESSWHGGCLALAELARRGLLLPSFLPAVSDILVLALNYDERRGNFSVGSNVRDAACYVCWSFARAYRPQQILPYINKIAGALIITMLFDREVNVRRAASAAFQENVGRQGSYPHGIDIINSCDYFAVGNKTQCFNELCLFVGKFDTYTILMIDDLTKSRIFHWDIAVRELCSQAIYNLCECAVDYMCNDVLKNILTKCLDPNADIGHGAVLTIYEIVRGIGNYARKQNSSIENYIDPTLQNRIRTIIIELRKKKLFNGNGRDNVQVAALQLLESICEYFTADKDESIISCYKEFIEDSVKSNVTRIQDRAIETINYFNKAFLKYCDGKLNVQLRDQFVDKFISYTLDGVEHVRVGSTRCLGALDAFTIHGRLDNIVYALLQAAVGSWLQKIDADLPEEVVGEAEVGKDKVEVKAAVGKDKVAVEQVVTADGPSQSVASDVHGDVHGDTSVSLATRILCSTAEKPRHAFAIASRIAAVNSLTRLLRTMIECEPIEQWSPEGQQPVVADPGKVVLEKLSSINVQRVFASLYTTLRDYTIDHRGDIGAHNREAAIHCLVALVDYLHHIKLELPRDIVTCIFAALMKQACEKIDKIRHLAASSFVKLLYNTQIKNNIHETEMKEIFNARQCKTTDWTKSEKTFKLFTRLLAIDDFNYHLLEGLAVSIGGLTESLSKHSRMALVEYCGSPGFTSQKMRILYINLLQVLKDNAKDSRVTMPLMKMMTDLFTRNVFVELYDEPQPGELLLSVLRNEMKMCSDTQKLINCGELYVCMLDIVSLRRSVLSKILVLIGHKFPIIRRTVALAFYEKVMMLEVPVSDCENTNDKLITMLGETIWDDSLGKVRASRNEIMTMLDIPLPKVKSQ